MLGVSSAMDLAASVVSQETVTGLIVLAIGFAARWLLRVGTKLIRHDKLREFLLTNIGSTVSAILIVNVAVLAFFLHRVESISSEQVSHSGRIQARTAEHLLELDTRIVALFGESRLNLPIRAQNPTLHCPSEYENDGLCDAIGFIGSSHVCPANSDEEDCQGKQRLDER